MTHRTGRSGRSLQYVRVESIVSAVLAWCLVLVVIAPCSVLAQSTDDDIDGPKIVHESRENAVPGLTQTFSATVTGTEVRSVTLLYRLSPDREYIEQAMLASNVPSRYVVDIEIEPSTVTIEYYIQAMDAAGNSRLRGNSYFALSRSVTNGAAEPSNRRTVLYSVLGAIAAGALIALAVGSDDEPGTGCVAVDGCNVNISIPRP